MRPLCAGPRFAPARARDRQSEFSARMDTAGILMECAWKYKRCFGRAEEAIQLMIQPLSRSTNWIPMWVSFRHMILMVAFNRRLP